MTNEEKKLISINLDQCIGAGDIKAIDEILLEMIENFDNYEISFLKFVLGYIGIYQKELQNLIPLYRKVYA